jgi:hypothetical protein
MANMPTLAAPKKGKRDIDGGCGEGVEDALLMRNKQQTSHFREGKLQPSISALMRCP